MKSVVVSGKNIEKAIEEGLKQLNTTFENVDINVISEGGFLKKAVVEITLTEEEVVAEVEKAIKKETPKKEVKEKPAQRAEKVIPAKSVKTEEIVKTEEEVALDAELQKVEEELLEITKTNNPENVSDNFNVKEEIVKFVEGLVYAYNLIAEVEVEKSGNEYFVKINGNNLGVLIGYHGEALEAVQYILSNYIHNKAGRHHKIVLDVEGYRQKRAESLQGMAENLAKKVVETKRSFRLDPMTAYERKVIHAHLQTIANIGTHSEGVEPKRYIVIDYVA